MAVICFPNPKMNDKDKLLIWNLNTWISRKGDKKKKKPVREHNGMEIAETNCTIGQSTLTYATSLNEVRCVTCYLWGSLYHCWFGMPFDLPSTCYILLHIRTFTHHIWNITFWKQEKQDSELMPRRNFHTSLIVYTFIFHSKVYGCLINFIW